MKKYLSLLFLIFVCSICSAQQLMRGEVSAGVYTNLLVSPVTSSAAAMVSNTPSISSNTQWLASAARTATVTMADQTNSSGARGIIIYCNVTAVPTIETLEIKIQGKDPVSGTYFNLAVPTATAVTGLITVKLLPGLLAVAPGVGGVTVSDYLPYTWRLVATHSSTGSWTYSCSYSLVQN